MRLNVNLDFQKFVSKGGTNQPVGNIIFVRGDNLQLDVYFYEQGAAISEDMGSIPIVFGGKSADKFDGDYLFQTDSYTKLLIDGNTVYRFDLNLNTQQLNDALEVDSISSNDIPQVVVNVELQWVIGDYTTSTIRQIATVQNDVNKGTEGIPESGNPSYASLGAVTALQAALDQRAPKDWVKLGNDAYVVGAPPGKYKKGKETLFEVSWVVDGKARYGVVYTDFRLYNEKTQSGFVVQEFYQIGGKFGSWRRTGSLSLSVDSWRGWRRLDKGFDSSADFHLTGAFTHVNQDLSNPESGLNIRQAKELFAPKINRSLMDHFLSPNPQRVFDMSHTSGTSSASIALGGNVGGMDTRDGVAVVKTKGHTYIMQYCRAGMDTLCEFELHTRISLSDPSKTNLFIGINRIGFGYLDWGNQTRYGVELSNVTTGANAPNMNDTNFYAIRDHTSAHTGDAYNSLVDTGITVEAQTVYDIYLKRANTQSVCVIKDANGGVLFNGSLNLWNSFYKTSMPMIAIQSRDQTNEVIAYIDFIYYNQL